MTSDFDELASAYLDGEATDAQVARVDSDPQLLARVAELRSLSEAMNVDVPLPDDLLKQRQIGAALEAFDAGGWQGSVAAGATVPASAPIDLGERRAKGAARATGSGGLPRWLGVAAVLLLVVGGVGVLTQIGGGSDDTDLATAADSGELEAGGADGEDASEVLTDNTMAAAREAADAAAPVAGSADGDDAEQSFAAEAEDEAASDEGFADSGDEESEEQAEEDADDAAPSTTVTVLPSTTAGGFFPEEELEAARVGLGASPTEAALLALADGARFDPALAGCVAEVEAADGLEVRFFVPVSVDGVDGEALFGGSEIDPVVVVVDGECAPLG
ncbi:MAG: anti-sigma factor family protein [Acidimicrobiales bacterium]